MRYAKVSNNQIILYPYTLGDLRSENPNVSFPAEVHDDLLAEYGVMPVTETALPVTTIFERVEEGAPTLVDGVWTQTWVTRPAQPPESITRRQCALQLLSMQYIASTEALAMTKSAEVPAAIAAIFDSAVANGTMTAEQRILAEIDFAAANYYRSNSLLGLMGLTEQQIDEFFIAASQL